MPELPLARRIIPHLEWMSIHGFLEDNELRELASYVERSRWRVPLGEETIAAVCLMPDQLARLTAYLTKRQTQHNRGRGGTGHSVNLEPTVPQGPRLVPGDANQQDYEDTAQARTPDDKPGAPLGTAPDRSLDDAIEPPVQAPQMRIAGLANFPAAEMDPEGLMRDLTRIKELGGEEVDVAFPAIAWLQGEELTVAQILEMVRKSWSGCLKVILDATQVGDVDHVASACVLIREIGADFVGMVGAWTDVEPRLDAFRVLLDGAGSDLGVKVSGGFYTTGRVAPFVEAVCQAWGYDWGPERVRFGGSALVTDVMALLAGKRLRLVSGRAD